MRKFLTVLGAICLGLILAFVVLLIQGKNPWVEDRTLPRLPTLPQVEEESKENDTLNLTYEQRLEKGDYYMERGFLSYAANEYVKAANLEPKELQPYLKLIEVHMQLGNYEKAKTNAQLALERSPNDLDIKFKLLLAEIKLSDFQTAKNLIEGQFTNTADPKVLYYLGLLNALFGNHDKAKSDLNAVKTSADEAFAQRASKVLQAYAEFEVSKAAEPIFLSQLLAKSFNTVQEYEMAIFLIKEVLKIRPELRDGWILLGFAYLNLEKYQFALTAFDKAFSIDSTWTTTLYFLGIVHKEMGDYQKSIDYFKSALKLNFKPKSVIDDHLADLYFKTKDYSNAALAYEALLKNTPADINAYVRPILIYLDYLNQPQNALKLAEAAALAFPETAMSYNLLGWSYIGLNDYKKALSNLNRAIKIDSGLPAAHYNLGLLYEKQEKDDLAMKSYQKAYELDTAGSIGSMAATRYNQILEN